MQVGVHVVAQGDGEGLDVVDGENPPKHAAARQQAIARKVQPVPVGRKVLQDVCVCALPCVLFVGVCMCVCVHVCVCTCR